MSVAEEHKFMRRVAGPHNLRLDGISDLLNRARGASVLDIGCNRGQVGYDFFLNGATVVHGCDIYEQGILGARDWFSDLRACESKFEIVDLTKGPSAVETAFGRRQYDVVVMLATYHKLKRVMQASALADLLRCFGDRTLNYFGWRATSEKHNENEGELIQLDRDLRSCGLRRIHTSYISQSLGVAAIWARR